MSRDAGGRRVRKCHRNRHGKEPAAKNVAEWAQAGQHCEPRIGIKATGAVRKSPTTNPLFGSLRVSETRVIQERGQHDRDTSFQFLCYSNNKNPDILSCSSHQNRVTTFTAEAGEISSNWY